jgi:hypothetical protein
MNLIVEYTPKHPKPPFRERYAIINLELRSPCGAGIGQLLYNYDGKVYTCDEGRIWIKRSTR